MLVRWAAEQGCSIEHKVSGQPFVLVLDGLGFEECQVKADAKLVIKLVVASYIKMNIDLALPVWAYLLATGKEHWGLRSYWSVVIANSTSCTTVELLVIFASYLCQCQQS